MAKGTTHGLERIEFVDPQTGAEIIQLTSNPTVSSTLYFENMNFTPDSKTLIFISRRTSERGAPTDLYRVDVDGRNLVQLTDGDGVSSAALSLDGKVAYFGVRSELRSVDLASFEEQVLYRAEDGASVGNPSVGGPFLFGRVGYPNDRSSIIRVNLKTGKVEAIREGKRIGHLNASRTGNWLAWIETAEINEYNTQTWYVMRSDGSDNRRWSVQNWAHSSWVGELDRMQGTLLPPGHGIVWTSPEEQAGTSIATGPYFWHSGASLDGEWIVSDTNWPDIGLQLVHVPTGRYGTLCLSQATNSNHPAHPHPCFSPDGRRVLYNSDRTGINQIYLVTIPDWLTDELRTGKLLLRHRVGPRRL